MNIGSLTPEDGDNNGYEVYLTALIPGAESCASERTGSSKVRKRKK
jgi:hypothetical protein